MMKRTLSFLLCLIMVLGLVTPAVQASAVDNMSNIYVEEGSSVTDLSDSAVQSTGPVPTEPVTTTPTQPMPEEFPAEQIPVVEPIDSSKVTCDCGVDAEEMLCHSDGCALKQFCIDLCAKDAMDIYNNWYCIGTAERTFVKEYLRQHYPEKLETLKKIWNADMIADENDAYASEEYQFQQLTGNASAQVDDITVDAYGIPEGSSLTVTDPNKKATNAVEEVVADLGKNPEQLFLYDISVQNDESNNWQPEGSSVRMTMSVPGLKLHKYAKVYVVHVDDYGNASTIEASVNEDGDITFMTEGFSTFGGFTVDFEYGTAYFSIKGLTEITLSELLEELKMPLYASDVTNLTFTDETLVSVTRLEEENDWLLTSLKAFLTKEKLTLTMNDGNEYVINVTDAYESPEIWVGGGAYEAGTEFDTGARHNDIVTWYSDGDGELNTQDAHWYWSGDLSWNDGYVDAEHTIWISGKGTFEIRIEPHPSYKTREKNFIRLQQIRIGHGVHLKVSLMSDYDSTSVKQVFLTCYNTANMFIVEEGASLELVGRAHTELVLDGKNDDLKALNSHVTDDKGLVASIDNQLIRLEAGATGFKASYVRFQDAPRSAIKARPTNMDTFELRNCKFDNDVLRSNPANNPPTGSGGAILLEALSNNTYTWITNFTLDNCEFNGCHAAESGGALGLYGRIRNITINNCRFNGTYAAKGYGGAIAMVGHVATMNISGTTFDKCSATLHGGAIFTGSSVLYTTKNTWSRLNTLSISNCTFKNSGAIANGKTINAAVGGALSIDSQTESITITGSTFNGLKATDGGAISFGYSNLNKQTASGAYAFMSNANFPNSTQNDVMSWRQTDADTWYWRTTLGYISMSNCDITSATVANQGGAIHFRTHSSAKQVIMDDVNIDKCVAVGDGSAIMLGDTIIPDFQYKNSTVQNCKTTIDNPNFSGGTFRTLGNTTCAASLTKVQFLNNATHCSGGGIYWNASGVKELYEGTAITTAIEVDQCTFDGNTAGWYGGGIFCEATMTITKCEVKNNVSILMGGGIALQLYNNNVRPFTDGMITDLTLDSSTNIHHNQSKVGGGLSIRANATQAIDNAQPLGHTIQFGLGGAQVHHNYATTNGGGVWFNVETYDFTDTESGGASNQQEVERFNKIINLSSGSVYSNIAGGNGGGIYMNGGTVTDPENTTTGTLTSNGSVSINLSGAAIYDNEAGRSATGVTISTNENVLPPVITVVKENGNIKFTKSTETGGNGGGIYLFGNTGVCTMTGGVVGATKNADGTPGTAYKNIATRSTDASKGGNGGGIAIFGYGRIVMEGGYVVNNMAETAGGGIAVHENSSMHLTSGYINNNQAHMGGGISLNNAKAYNASGAQDQDKYGLFLNGGTISSNRVTPDTTRGNIAYGGGICISGTSSAKISNGLITQNTAASTTAGTTFASGQEGGGVAACEGGRIDIAGGTISENKAYAGGGMVVRGASIVNMSGSITVIDGKINESYATGVIKKNYAYQDGGGVYLGAYKGYNVNKFTMTNGWIYDNNADNGKGGAVYVSMYNGFYLHGGYIEENTSQSNGGAVYCTQGVVEIYNGHIQGNYTEGNSAHGGGVCMDRATLTISNGTIQNNKTKGTSSAGGAFYVGNSSTMTITNGTIQNNTTEGASGYGGAIAVLDSTMTISNGLIQNNRAKGSDGRGGAIYARQSTLTITNGIIKNNISDQQSGGGIHIRYGKLYFQGNEESYGSLLNNKAPNGCGGGIFGYNVEQVDIDYLNAEGNSSMYGGATYLEYCTNVMIDGGIFTKNYANQGGGLFVRCCKGTITGGTFTWNVAGPPEKLNDGTYLYKVDSQNQHGGGVVIDDITSTVDDCSMAIQGGDISHNSAPLGGGICIKNIYGTGGSPVVTMTGGSITHNTANHGGGVYADGKNAAATGDTTTFIIKGGDISYNTANGYGGGVYATKRADVQILENAETSPVTHGTIDYNKAHCGGGVAVTYGATLDVNNGYIIYNTAFVPAKPGFTPATTGYQQLDALYGAGGGVFIASGNSSSVISTFTLKGTDMAVYGNEAGYCADDVFSNGKYTKLDMPLVSSMNLAGYGFNPEGWVEDYNPDDANYWNTYGLRMYTANEAPVKLAIQRYRSANGIQRRYSLIKTNNGKNYVRGNEDIEGAAVASYNYVNKTGAYVAMTLGIPGAVDDTIVVDFGRNVNIGLINNDLFMDEEDFAATGELGLEMPGNISEKDGIYYSSAKNGADHKGKFYAKILESGNLKYGAAELGSDGHMTYDIGHDKASFTFDQPESMTYTVKHGDNWFYAKITIVPATSIYYDDTENQITYHETSSKETLAKWTTAVNEQNEEQNEEVQDEDRPGAAMIEGLDADNIYGYDKSYASCTTYSDGNAHKVTVSHHDAVDVKENNGRGDGICDKCHRIVRHSWVDANNDNTCDTCKVTGCPHNECVDGNNDNLCDRCGRIQEHECIDNKAPKNICDICGRTLGRHSISARASFTFTGTGFDIISLCSVKTGIVMVNVYQGTNIDFDNPDMSKYVTSYMVDTYLKYRYDENKKQWVEATPNDNTLYQIYQVPVIKADLTKIVEEVTDKNNDGVLEYKYKDCGYGTYTVELYVAPSFLEREAGYWSADFYLDAIRIYNPAGVGSFENPVANQTVQDAYLADNEGWPEYIELRNMLIAKKNLNLAEANGAIFIDGITNPTLKEYQSWGPNNEIYLNPGQSIAFKMDMTGHDDVAGIQVGMRTLTGKSTVYINYGTSVANSNFFKSESVSATDMYYDLSWKNSDGSFRVADKVVIISNEGTVNPIAITNIKVTHTSAPTRSSDIDIFKVSEDIAETAMQILGAGDLVESPVVTPERPALSFNGMVCYNVFFSTPNMGDLPCEDVGLAVFSTEDTEGTIETAREVIYGATKIDGMYMTATSGVHAKNLGDRQYFRAFAKAVDGSLVYSKMVSYSAVDYAKNVLAKSTDVKLKQLVVAMLNYGAEAQKFFGYKTDDLMNASLTADDQALLSGFNANSLNAVGKVDASKIGAFASTGGFTKKSPAISFKGAFEINYFFTPAHVVEGDMKLYFWNEDTYNSVEELTAENADKTVTMTTENGSYTASSDEIAAKYLDQTVYVAAVYESGGETYCSGVLPYSIAAYCQKPPAGVQDLAVAAAIYGCTAKQYFGV